MDREPHPGNTHGRRRQNRSREGTPLSPSLPPRANDAHPARLSLVQNVIEIHRPALPVYQTVIEKTRGLSIRTQALGAAMARANTQPVEGAR